MSLAEGFTYVHGELRFLGYSLAGITTSVVFKNASVCFDVGQGLPFQNSARKVLITHAHLDHAAGVPYLIAQKNMMGIRDTEFFVPASLEKPLHEILRIWQEVDGHEYSYSLRAAEPGILYDLDKIYVMKPFPTVHRVPSQGYLVFQKKKRLKEALREQGEEAIRAAKSRGEDPNEYYLDPLVAFTGDTQIEFLGRDPDVERAKVLFLEATFWDAAKPVAHARRWGHIHLDEILEILPKLRNERIVLIHASVRYPSSYLRKILREKLPKDEQERVVLFPRDL